MAMVGWPCESGVVGGEPDEGDTAACRSYNMPGGRAGGLCALTPPPLNTRQPKAALSVYSVPYYIIPQRQLTGRAAEWRCASLHCYSCYTATSAIITAYRHQPSH
ncbi:hypothetical protein ACI65C_012901 [Semiaphis heraclei]